MIAFGARGDGGCVLGYRVATVRDAVGIAQFIAHVERFEFLDRVGGLRDHHGVANHGEQVNEHAFAGQGEDLLETDVMPGGETFEGDALVVGVVVDVHIGVLRPTTPHIGQEVDEGLLLLGAIMRPERDVDFGTAWIHRLLNEAEEVLQPAFDRTRGGPHRVAFEVEVEVARARRR